MNDGAIVMKVHRTGGGLLVAACDEELLGREIKIGMGRQLISSSFYGSTRVELPALLQNLREASIANLLGERAVRHAVEAGIVTEEATGFLGDVPHAEFVRF